LFHPSAHSPPMFEPLYNYLYHQSQDGGIPLKGTGIVLGLFLLAIHLWAFFRAEATRDFLHRFPRNYPIGVGLLTIGFLWAMLIISHMDMGEFHFLRPKFQFIIPAAFVAVLLYVKEFLSVRALGSLMLLAAGPLLCAAFLQPQTSRLLIPILTYAWIIIGMFFVGMPFLMRDWIGWATADNKRWNALSIAGAAYGAVVLIFALIEW